MGKLTEAKGCTIKATDKDQWLNDGDGLYLRFHKGGSKVWIIRRKRFGKTQIITLDPYPTMKQGTGHYPRRTGRPDSGLQ